MSGDIRVIARLVQLLRLLGEAGGIDLVTAARELGVGRSTAHRYLASMENHGMLQRRGRNHYEFGALLAELGTMALSRLGVVDLARPVMERISTQVRHTVVLTIWNGRAPVVAHVHEDTSRTTYVSIRQGSVLRRGTAQDCVFRAFQRQSFYRFRDDHRFRGDRFRGDAVNGEVTDADLETVRRTGVAIRSSAAEGMRAVAVPIWDANDLVVAAMAVVGVSRLVPDAEDSDVVMALRDGAREINQALRASPDSGSE